jgi:hypothetical protein
VLCCDSLVGSVDEVYLYRLLCVSHNSLVHVVILTILFELKLPYLQMSKKYRLKRRLNVKAHFQKSAPWRGRHINVWPTKGEDHRPSDLPSPRALIV